MKNNNWAEAVNFLQEGDRFLVVSHIHPDGDAIGSTCAVASILDQLGKSYTLINASGVPEKFAFLSHSKRILTPEQVREGDPFSRVVAVDVADAERMGDIEPFIAEDGHILNIDHHPTNDRFGAVNLIIDHAASTTEILCQLADELGLTWDLILAESLYTGLLTDTGGFRYANTTPAVMKLASRLLAVGVDAAGIADRTLETMTQNQLQLLQRSLDTLTFADEGRIAWMWLSRQDFIMTGANENDMDGIVNYARNVVGVDVGILFRETSTGDVKASLRSREIVDVGALAQSLGGGGHARAAGCTLRGSRNEVERRLLDQVKQRLREGSES
ncbi:DHH family phosphoesterase [Marininema halotolerans]|uniref:Phosphoesterase RecJ domain-containing protein n=1 Tax=Marininema halotolerans TaxID=1155944 RepID=A0A1I6R5A2_9BACL|nr:bifunctional oligoribonuclease/PAP phosphatase NrnA [Marininema halotolerans]SFS59760.1 phosphoesterase RecJ domain-containing protein [Marininema halotolerans]